MRNSNCKGWLVAIGLWLTFGTCMAEDGKKRLPLEYGYMNTVEFMFGPYWNMKSYGHLPDDGRALQGQGYPGYNGRWRYSRFIDRRWGAFFQFDVLSGGENPETLVNAYNRKYGLTGSDRFRYSYTCWDDVGEEALQLLVGPVYRIDFGRWSFRPRVGVGFRFQDGALGSTLEREQHVGSEKMIRDYVSFEPCTKSGGSYYNCSTFAYGTSAQIMFTTYRHFFFTAEVSLIGTIGHTYQKTTRTNYQYKKIMDDPDKVRDYIQLSKSENVSINRVHTGNFGSVTLGVGWNIGKNRRPPGPL